MGISSNHVDASRDSDCPLERMRAIEAYSIEGRRARFCEMVDGKWTVFATVEDYAAAVGVPLLEVECDYRTGRLHVLPRGIANLLRIANSIKQTGLDKSEPESVQVEFTIVKE